MLKLLLTIKQLYSLDSYYLYLHEIKNGGKTLKTEETRGGRHNANGRLGGLTMDSLRKSIIYVDDIHFGLVTVKDRLRSHYEVFIAQSVDKMFEILEQFNVRKQANPDIILLDLNMPEVDGFDAIKELKCEPRYRNIPVIFLSSKNDEDTMTIAMGLGAADYVTKPFTDSFLIERIEYQLDLKKNRKQ